MSPKHEYGARWGLKSFMSIVPEVNFYEWILFYAILPTFKEMKTTKDISSAISKLWTLSKKYRIYIALLDQKLSNVKDIFILGTA